MRRGLLSRQRGGGDARSVAISLTESGRAIALQLVPIAQLYERIALSGFEEHEVAQLKEWLRRVYRNITSSNAGPLRADALKRIYERIIDEMRTLQKHRMAANPGTGEPKP